LLGELVSLALQEEGGINEGIVIQTERMLDDILGMAQGLACEGFPLAVTWLTNLEFQAGVFPFGRVRWTR